MSEQSDRDPISGMFREITWEIGESELQKSVMAVETFEALRDGQTNVREIRAKIRQKRKLKFTPSTGKWTDNPSDRLVNEHAWVLSLMNQVGMIEKVDQRTHQNAFCPARSKSYRKSLTSFGATNRLSGSPGPTKRLRNGDERRAIAKDCFSAALKSRQNAERSHARKIAVVSDERRGVDSQRARGLDSVG